jgi:hypothetical protein
MDDFLLLDEDFARLEISFARDRLTVFAQGRHLEPLETDLRTRTGAP